DPVPYLLGLACAANVGSALTLNGNPQNMLIGESLRLSFGGYLREAAVPVLLGLAVTWGVIIIALGGRWDCPSSLLATQAAPEPPAAFAPDARACRLGAARALRRAVRRQPRVPADGTDRRGRAGDGGCRHPPPAAGRAVRADVPAEQHRLQRPGGDAAAAARDPPHGRDPARAREHPRGELTHRREHREHHRGGRRRAAGPAH